MTQRNVRLKSATFLTLKPAPHLVKQERSSETRPRIEKLQSAGPIRLVTQTTRISARRPLIAENSQRTYSESPIDLYRCRCGEAKTNDQIVCWPHEMSNRIPHSWH